MPRRARFTQSEMFRLLGAIKEAGIKAVIEVTDGAIRIVPIEKREEAEKLVPGLRHVEGKDIIL